MNCKETQGDHSFQQRHLGGRCRSGIEHLIHPAHSYTCSFSRRSSPLPSSSSAMVSLRSGFKVRTACVATHRSVQSLNPHCEVSHVQCRSEVFAGFVNRSQIVKSNNFFCMAGILMSVCSFAADAIGPLRHRLRNCGCQHAVGAYVDFWGALFVTSYTSLGRTSDHRLRGALSTTGTTLNYGTHR